MEGIKKETLKIKKVILLNSFLKIGKGSLLFNMNTNLSDHCTDQKLPLSNLSTPTRIYSHIYPTGSYGSPTTWMCHTWLIINIPTENSGQASRYTLNFFFFLICFNPPYYVKVDEKLAWILLCPHPVLSSLFFGTTWQRIYRREFVSLESFYLM